jgi:hypothetical protein
MSREILEAMHALAREKGIEPEKLMVALEDALLSAYKKQPGSAKYARVEMDRETADFRVIELIIPERLEAHLIVETRAPRSIPRRASCANRRSRKSTPPSSRSTATRSANRTSPPTTSGGSRHRRPSR